MTKIAMPSIRSIRLLASAGLVLAAATVAGLSTKTPAAAASPGQVTTFGNVGMDNPDAITAGPDGNLWFTNSGNNSIGSITTSGVVSNYTGTGIDDPDAVTAGPDGNLWFTNSGNNSIGSITTSGVVSNYTGTGIDDPDAVTAGPDGNLWFTNQANNSIGSITTSGVVSNYTGAGIDDPDAITAGPDGNLWFTNLGNNSIGSITTSGVVSNYTGAHIEHPDSITTGPDGNLWFVNAMPNFGSVGSITTSGVVGPNYEVLVNSQIMGITSGPDGQLWFTSRSPNYIGSISTAGDINYYNGSADNGIEEPGAITDGPDGNLWFANANNSIGMMSASGASQCFTGTPINSPDGLASGPDGALWFTNAGNNSIGRISTSGSMSSFSGTGIDYPSGITAGPDGAMWFTNRANNSIGRVTVSGVVTNYTAAGIDDPTAITAGPDGNLWFTNDTGPDVGTASIGRITPEGVITIFPEPNSFDNSFPNSITVGPDGALWFTNENYSIGRITTAGVITDYSSGNMVDLYSITPGPDGALWFVNNFDAVGRITTSGSVTSFTNSGIDGPASIAAGSDGALWFQNTNGTVGRITTTGIVSDYPSPGSGGGSVAEGTNGNIWFLERNNLIGEVTPTAQTTSTTITSVTQNLLVGEPITVDVQVVPDPSDANPAPTGPVVVSDGNGQTCLATLSGSSGTSTGSCQLSEGAQGTYELTAGYGGDANFSSSSTAIGTQVVVSPASTTTDLNVYTPSPVVGQPITVGVVVSPTTTDLDFGPTGSVTFSDGNGQTCSDMLVDMTGTSSAVCSFVEASPGDYSMSASYPGDGNYLSSATSSATQVDVAPSTTTTELTSGTQDPAIGEPITIDVRVAGGYTGPGEPTPPGSVAVTDGTRSCIANLSGSSGVALGSCEITEDASGEYGFSGNYQGDNDFLESSTSGPTEIDVSKDFSATRLTLSPKKVTYGREKTLKMSVTVSAGVFGTPEGQVTITTGSKTLCSIQLSGGSGVCSLASKTALKVRSYELVATYEGNAIFNPSSASTVLTIKRA